MSLEAIRASVNGIAAAVSANIDDAINQEGKALSAIRDAVTHVRDRVKAVDDALAELDAVLTEKSADLIGAPQAEERKKA